MNIQRTLKSALELKGVGVHSGKTCWVRFVPADPGTGIVIRRHFAQKVFEMRCSLDFVTSTQNQISLGINGISVKTIEHVLSALSGLGVTNCFIETESDEMPVMDGSAYPFIEAIMSVGLTEQKAALEPLRIPHPIWVSDEDRHLIVLPSDDFRISYNISYPNKELSSQYFYLEMTQENYVKEISKARTFGFLENWKALRAKGLALGSSIENTVVYSNDGLINASLRFDDECVRHKILDLIGDLALLGRPLLAYVVANKGGHSLDFELVSRIRELIIDNVFTKKQIQQHYKEFEKQYAHLL